MRTIEEYMRLPYRMEIIPDTVEGGFAVRFPELPGCLTCGDTLEEAVRNAADCKKEWLIAAMEEGISIPEPVSEEEYSGQLKEGYNHEKNIGSSFRYRCSRTVRNRRIGYGRQ